MTIWIAPSKETAVMQAKVTSDSERKAQLEAVRAQLAKLASEGRIDDALDLAVEMMSHIADANTALEARLFTALRRLYGRRSETIDAAQLALFLAQLDEDSVPEGAKLDEPVVPEPEPGPAAPEPVPPVPPVPPPVPPKKKKKKKRAQRQPLPAHLPREPYNVPVPEAERPCPTCNGQRCTLGYLESEVLEFRPAQFIVLVPRREKLVCRPCEGEVTIADDDKLASRSRPGPALLADVIVNKWRDSLPLERQADRYKRLGVMLAPSTLGDWAAMGLDMLAPIARRIAQRVLLSSYVQADDTLLKVLDASRKPAVKRGHLWAFVAMEIRLVSFLFAPNWAADKPAEFLRNFGGHLQGDDYRGYAKILAAHEKAKRGARVEGAEDDDEGDDEDDECAACAEDDACAEHHACAEDDACAHPLAHERKLGCGMHIRRKFEAAAKLGDPRGAIALSFFRKIYMVEAMCKIGGLDTAARHEARQTQSLPLVDEFYRWVSELHPKLIPKSPIYLATRYALAQREVWVRCFSDGRFEIDNGEVERQIRAVALGRKNWLFAGSDAGAVRAAIAFSILGSCRMHGLDPYAYVLDVLRKLAAGWPMSRIDELLPDAWRPDAATAAATAAESA